VDQERLDHGEAGETEHAVVDREQDLVDRPVEAVLRIDRRAAADSESAHGALAGENAAVVPLAAAIDAAAGDEHAVNPALENRRQPEPPERKLEDQGVAPEKLVHLRLDVGGKSIVNGGIRLFSLLAIVVRIAHGREVAAIRHRIEAHCIKVGDNDLVPGRNQRLLSRAR